MKNRKNKILTKRTITAESTRIMRPWLHHHHHLQKAPSHRIGDERRWGLTGKIGKNYEFMTITLRRRPVTK